MRDILIIKSALSNGLRSTEHTNTGDDYLVECRNVRPMKNGLWPYEDIICPISAEELQANGVVASWPFPQIIRGREITLLCTSSSVFEVNEDDWTLTPISLIKAQDVGAERLSNTSLDSGTGWTLTNASISGGKVSFSGNVTASCVQGRTAQSLPLEIGRRYRVATTVEAESGFVCVKLGTAFGTYHAESGTWYEEIVCTGNTDFTIQGDSFVGSVSAVSVREVPPLNCVKNGSFELDLSGWSTSGFSYMGGVARATVASSYILQNIANQAKVLDVGKTYTVTYSIALAGGTCRVKIGSTNGTIRTNSGTYQEDLVATGNCAVQVEMVDGGLLDLQNIAVEEKISAVAGGRWHFTDFGKVWFLHNGNCTIFRGADNNTYLQTDQTIRTGCACRGRAITAGFSDDFWSDEWRNQWDTWIPSVAPQFSSSLMTLPGNCVMWSSIGGGDTLLWQYPSLALSPAIGLQYFGLSSPIMKTYMERNEFGYMVMPFQGDVLCVKELGKGVMVYGEDGICYLRMESDPVPTFGLDEVFHHGVLGRASVGGDSREHLFIDKTGCLWRIGIDLIPHRLGYEEYILPLMNNAIVIDKDEQRNIYHVSGVDKGVPRAYILTESGLAEVGQAVMSCFNAQGGSLGIFMDTDVDSNLITTDSIDMGTHTIKTLHSVSVVCTSVTNITVSVGYRFNKNEDFVFTTPANTDSKGNLYTQVCGTEFRVRVSCADFTVPKIDRIELEWSVGNRGASSLYLS
jgi:hypothetical protein